MKKLLRIAVVVGMVLCLGVTAFAANNSQSGATYTGAVNADGQSVEVTATATDVTLTTTEAADVAGDAVEAADLSVVYVQDIDAEIPEGGSVTITFEVPGATADDTVYVMHYNGTEWELVATCKGNDVKATFTSLSPVALVLEKAAATEPAPGTDESPKTGEEPALLIAGAVALLAGVTAVVALKKREEV